MARHVTINLSIGYKTVNYTGKPAEAVAIDGTIPGPTLRFHEGDVVTIYVHNHIKEPTAIHWHGLIVPWRMDGTAWVSQKPIPPGGVFRYHFKIKQSGTYWYHAHYELQEQRGVYGALIITPRHKRYHFTKDFTIVLSDWINTKPSQVFDNLKKMGEYYETGLPLQSSLAQFIKLYRHASPAQKKRLLHTYYTFQKTRMGVYDLADIAYPVFLLNGHTPTYPWKALVKLGDTVRLRIIDAGTSTYFHVKIPGTKMKVINYEGNNVKPYRVNSLLLGPGETYDVAIKITQKHPYIIYAESLDTSGAAIGALVTHQQQKIDTSHIKPFPKPQPMAMQPIKPSTVVMMKYRKMQALKPTNNPNKPVHVIRMKLSGYMGRFMWFINGKEIYYAKPINIVKGQRYRIIFTNMSLMHHPMHLHGHWFILRNGHGAYDPLIHTVDVAPFHTVIVDFDADASGQWLLHCHNLYHFKAGMARILRYQPKQAAPITQQKQQKQFAGLNGSKQSWDYDINLQLLRAVNINNYQFTGQFVGGSDYNKLQIFINQAEMTNGNIDNFDSDIFYMRLLSQFWSIKGGVNYVNEPAVTPYWQPGIGIQGALPFFIDTDLRIYEHRGSVKFDLDLTRQIWIYKILYLNMEIRTIWATKTVPSDMVGSGLNVLEISIGPSISLNNRLSLVFQYENDRFYGAQQRLRAVVGDPQSENFFYIGLSLLL